MPQLNSARIIGYTRKGCPIREIRGGSAPVVEPAGGQGNDDIGDLLGDLGVGDPGDGGDGGSGDGGDGGSGDGGEQPPAWWGNASAGLEQRLEQKVNSTVDRRINQLVQNNRNRNQGGQGNQGNQGGGQPAAVHDPGDVRYARSVARETLADQSVKLTAAERELVNQVTPGWILSELGQDPDPDRAGDKVGRAAAALILKVRREHQTQIINQLEARGALDRSKLKPGQQQQVPGAVNGKTTEGQWNAGANKAAEMAARRGRKTPGQESN